jgi:hypothetical protein
MSEMCCASGKQSYTANLAILPPELILLIAGNLNITDLSRFSRTCRHLTNVLQRDLFVKATLFPHLAMFLACKSLYSYTPTAIIDRALAFRVPEDVNTVLVNPSNGYVHGTPLEIAVEAGRVSTVAHLLDIGADPNAPAAARMYCSTVLGTAISCFHTKCCQLASGTYYQNELRNFAHVISLLLEGGANPAAPFIYYMPRNRGEVAPIYEPLPRFVKCLARTINMLKKPDSRPGHMLDEVRQFVKAIIAELLARGASMEGVDEQGLVNCHEA